MGYVKGAMPPRVGHDDGHLVASPAGGAGAASAAHGTGGGRGMTLVDRLYDNDWYVTSAEQAAHTDLAVEVIRAAQTRDMAAADVERARLISPAAVSLALASSNSAQAALDRAQARAAAAARCTHILDGHAFTVQDGRSTGTREVNVASCTLERRRRCGRRPSSGCGRRSSGTRQPLRRQHHGEAGS